MVHILTPYDTNRGIAAPAIVDKPPVRIASNSELVISFTYGFNMLASSSCRIKEHTFRSKDFFYFCKTHVFSYFLITSKHKEQTHTGSNNKKQMHLSLQKMEDYRLRDNYLK